MKSMSAISLKPQTTQGGFAAVIAVFILIVLGGLGVVMVTIFGGQQRASAYDALGSRAYQAARSGVEVGTSLALNAAACGNTTFAMASFTVAVTCAATVHTEGTKTTTVFQITSTACTSAPSCPGDASDNYIERQVRATVVSQVP